MDKMKAHQHFFVVRIHGHTDHRRYQRTQAVLGKYPHSF